VADSCTAPLRGNPSCCVLLGEFLQTALSRRAVTQPNVYAKDLIAAYADGDMFDLAYQKGCDGEVFPFVSCERHHSRNAAQRSGRRQPDYPGLSHRG